jgi:HEAT repeat protein
VSDYRPDIWRLQAQSDVAGLIQALSNGDPGIRKRAAAALRALGASHAVPSLTEALSREADPDVRSHLLAALETLSDDTQYRREESAQPPEQTRVATLIAQLSSKQPERVIAAVYELGDSNDKLVVEPLVMLFNNNTQLARVRLAAAEALLKLNSAPAEVSLLGALRGSNWQARRNAAAILGQLKAEWAIEPLGKALADEHEIVRRTAYAALKYIGTPDSLKMLAGYRRTAQPAQEVKPAARTPLRRLHLKLSASDSAGHTGSGSG